MYTSLVRLGLVVSRIACDIANRMIKVENDAAINHGRIIYFQLNVTYPKNPHRAPPYSYHIGAFIAGTEFN